MAGGTSGLGAQRGPERLGRRPRTDAQHAVRGRIGMHARDADRAATRLSIPQRASSARSKGDVLQSARLDSKTLRFHHLVNTRELSSSGGIDMALVRWEPVRELSSLQNDMNRLFNTFFDTPTAGNGGPPRRWIPAMDLVETDDHFVLKADLPGLTEDDVNIEVEDNVLTVSGERKARARGQARGLRTRRALVRLVPPLADAARGRRRRGRHARASTSGVLEIRIPKPEAAQAAPRRDPGRPRPAAGRGRRGRLVRQRRPPTEPAGPRSARARGRSSAPRPPPRPRASIWASISASTSASARRRRVRSTNQSATPPRTTSTRRRSRRGG